MSSLVEAFAAWRTVCVPRCCVGTRANSITPLIAGVVFTFHRLVDGVMARNFDGSLLLSARQRLRPPIEQGNASALELFRRPATQPAGHTRFVSGANRKRACGTGDEDRGRITSGLVLESEVASAVRWSFSPGIRVDSPEIVYFSSLFQNPCYIRFFRVWRPEGTEIRTKTAADRLWQGGADEAHLRPAARGLGL